MMTLKAGKKEYQLKFGYKATLKSHILSRLAKMENAEDLESMEGVENLLIFLPDIFLIALQKFHREEFGFNYETGEGKDEKLDAVYDVMEEFFDGGGDASELYNNLVEELKSDSFLSKMFDEEKAKSKNAKATAPKAKTPKEN